MLTQVISTTLKSLAIGFIVSLISSWLASDFLESFFKANLITLLVALLAVNAATMGIVLAKMRDLIDKFENPEAFEKTKKNMLLSIKEQIALIVTGTVILTIKSAGNINQISNMPLLLDSVITGIFAYALFILYDTAKSVLVIIDFDAS